MAGISSNALKGTQYSKNRKEFNGIEHTTDLDLNQYDAVYRTLDPQIGRWWQIDPKCETFEDYSPYNHVLNNPISISDPFGDDTTRMNELPAVWPDFNPDNDVVQLNGIQVTPSGARSDLGNQVLFGVTYGFGYKVMPSRNFFVDLLLGGRNYGGYTVDNNGILTRHQTVIAGYPPDYIDAGGNPLGTARRTVEAVEGASSIFSHITSKIVRQMERRGWTRELIHETINNPFTTRVATNRATGNAATAYFEATGSYVVKDNVTNEIIQVSNRLDPNWIPDATITNLFIP